MSFRKFTGRTITSRKPFLDELARTRSRGYGVDLGEEEEGQHCVGAAILDSHSYPVGALWITAPSSRLSESQFPEVAAELTATAAQISHHLGHRKAHR